MVGWWLKMDHKSTTHYRKVSIFQMVWRIQTFSMPLFMPGGGGAPLQLQR